MPGSRPRRILVAYSKASTFTSTTVDYLLALKKFTDYEVHYVHCALDARMTFDFNEYDVLFHNYCGRLCFEGYVSPDYERAVANFRGLKIIAVQDDYDRTATFHRALRRMGFHVLLTCIQREFWPLAYPASELPGVHIIQGLTGYMPEKLLENRPAILPLDQRLVPIAYRGRDIGAKYGRLGYDKFFLGQQMIQLCEERGLPHDIAMDDASRLYGDAWFEFLGSSRTMLGSESGSNAFDYDGDLEAALAAFEREHGRKPSYQDVRDILDPLEAPFNVGQISPRAFECAVMMTPMILFKGSYSGAMEPDVHYISLEKDFSNADAILSRLDDLDYLQGFADRAFARLVSSGQYGYQTLAHQLRDTIEEQYPLRVNQYWVRYCESTRSRFVTLDRLSDLSEIERIKHKFMIEIPTEYPTENFDYNALYDELANAIEKHHHTIAEEELLLSEKEIMKFEEIERLRLKKIERLRLEETERFRSEKLKLIIVKEQGIIESAKGSPNSTHDSQLDRVIISVPGNHVIVRTLRASWRVMPERLRFNLSRLLRLS